MTLLKAGIAFLFGTFTHYIFIIIWTEHVWMIKFLNGGVGGTVAENINPLFYSIINKEFALSILLILIGIGQITGIGQTLLKIGKAFLKMIKDNIFINKK